MMPFCCFDAHCDTLSALKARGASLGENDLHLDLTRLGRFPRAGQVFALFTRPRDWNAGGRLPNEAEAASLGTAYRELRDFALAVFRENEDRLRLCRSAQEARQAMDAGKIAAFLAVEGAELLSCDEGALEAAYRDGARLVNLTWNDPNLLSGSNRSGGGLTNRGYSFLRRAQGLGMAVDLSHISDEGFWDCVAAAEKPLLAGHSNARALCNHPRNLTDEMFLALRDMGGVVGLNFCPDFLGDDPELDSVRAHMEHFLALGGEKTLCLGSDFDGIEATPRGLRGAQDFPALWEHLLSRGFSEALLEDIFMNNLLSYLDRAL